MAGDRKEQDEAFRKENVNTTKSKQTDKDSKNQNLLAPDGGWGWMIVMAAGFSNFCVLSVVQLFGLLFMDKFAQLGITSSEITTLTSSNCAVTAFLGLANGPLFRKFTFRKIALFGSLLCTFSTVMLSFAKSFTEFLAFFSIVYGCGIGFTLSSNTLALNTYFKEKRRIAIALSWTCAGMGPIIMPQIITLLMPKYGHDGTILLFGGFTFHAVACSLILQPVSWHMSPKKKKTNKIDEEMIEIKRETVDDLKNGAPLSKSMENILHRRPSILTESRNSLAFGSQYLYYDDDDAGASGIDVIEASSPMMAKSNDGWHAKKTASTTSLESSKQSRNEKFNNFVNVSLNSSRQQSLQNLHQKLSTQNLYLNNSNCDKNQTNMKDDPFVKTPLLPTIEANETNIKNLEENNNVNTKNIKAHKTNTLRYWIKRTCKSIVEIFDLKLLKDPVYVNMMMGLNLANFVELNFALITAFILGSYGFSRGEIATWMSVLAGMDVCTRLLVPLVSTYIRLSNRSFFLIGVCSMALGRIILAHVRNYTIMLFVAALIGTGKALRTIFIALVIPGYVPLDRLPAALGLQLVSSGIIFFVVGPVIGWIQDTAKNYAVTLHCLNILTYLVAISWLIEFSYFKFWNKQKEEDIKT